MKGTVKKPGILLDFMLELMQTTKKKPARQMLKFGGVTLDGKAVKRGAQEVKPGQVVEISRSETPSGILYCSSKSPIQIHYEDKALIVAQKPAGLLSVGTPNEKKQTMHALLYSYVKDKEGGRVFAVHRLDRNVGGLMVFAKTAEVKNSLQGNWEDVEKRYVALVSGKPPAPEGKIETWLDEVAVQKVMVTEKSPHSKYSITEYNTRKNSEAHSLLDINLITGRRHQIRVHLSHIGCPIIGDRIYGKGTHGSNDILLFSYFLSFLHPETQERVTFDIPIPKWDMSGKRRSNRKR